jgi:hypothetical protein
MSRQLYIEDALLSLKDMMRLDIRRITAEDRVYIRGNRTKEDDPGVLFLSGESLINTYYLQSVSLVGFLIERYGSERFARFCRDCATERAWMRPSATPILIPCVPWQSWRKTGGSTCRRCSEFGTVKDRVAYQE